MGGKRRNIDTVEEGEGVVDIATENSNIDKSDSDHVSSSPVKKKIKKKQKGEKADGDTKVSSSVKPMERRKKRKLMDKERHKSALADKEVQVKNDGQTLKGEESGASIPSSSASSGMSNLRLSVFNDLTSGDVSVRQTAAEILVKELQEVQKAYVQLGDKSAEANDLKLEANKDDGLEECAPSLRYAIRRLIRGVSSSRECARQGFALGLTLSVGTLPSIKVESLLKLIVDLLEVSSSMKGQEVRDCLLGRLFAYGALARSGRLTTEWNSDKNTPYIKDFTSVLISLAAKKRYLQEPAASVILELVEKLPADAVVSHVLESPGLHEWFDGANEVGNPDALVVALKIREKISDDSKKFGELLPNPFSRSKLFAADHLFSLANCLKESTFCQPRVHSVWPVLVNILLPDTVLQAEDAASASTALKKHRKSRKSSSTEEEVSKSFQSFCEIVIEGSLLLSSHDRKHLAFDILLLLLPRMPASFVSIVLSYKFVQCLMDILSTKDSWLYKVAHYFLKELIDWVGNDDVRRAAVIVALQMHSNGKFDSVTRTKVVKDLMADFKTESGCMLFIQDLVNMFVDEGQASEEPSDQSQTTDDNSEIVSLGEKDPMGPVGSADYLKIWIIESLPSILKYLKLDPEAKFRVQKEILKFLAVQGLFSASLGTEVTSFELQEKFRWPKAASSSGLCHMCIEQLQLLLSNSQKVDGLHSLATGMEPNDLGSFFMMFLSKLHNIPSVSLFRSVNDEDEQAFKKLQEMETRLSREEKNSGLSMDADKLHALRYLLIQLLLQVLLRPGEFSEAASELVMCCKKAFASSDLLNSSAEDESDGDSTPEFMDVLVDTLLSLLPQSSAPLRSAIEQVFKYFCDDLTGDGLMRMLRVIKKDLKPARHRNTESDEEEDDDEEDLLGIEEEEDSDEVETGETAESDEQSDDSEAVAVTEGVGTDIPEGSDDSDGGMDDEAMFRMDTYLAHIVKEKKNQSGGETAQSQLVLFKLRVLSLLEIYLHENPGKPQVLTVYSNLAQAFVNPHTTEGSEQLGQRIWGILQKKIFKAKYFPKSESVQLPTLEPLLEKNLKLASKPFKRKKSAASLSKKKQSASLNRHKMIGSLARNSTFWILKIIDARNFSESELQRVFDIFREVLVGYFDTKKSQIKSDFLKEIFRRRPWIGHHLFGFFLEKCASAKSVFRRVESLDLVMEILKSLVPLNSDEVIREASKKKLKSHLRDLRHVIEKLVTNMPEKQSRRAEVRKFCAKIFQMLSTLNLTKPFLKDFPSDAHAACESQLGDMFIKLKKVE